MFTILLGVAIIGATRISINLNTISAFSTGFIVLQLLIITNYMSLKFHYGMKTRLSNKEILSYSLKQTKSLLIISISIIVSLWIVILMMVLLESSTNLYNYLMIWLFSIFGFLGSILISPILFASFMMLRELYLSKISNNNHKTKHQSYDKIDEQIIIGINHN